VLERGQAVPAELSHRAFSCRSFLPPCLLATDCSFGAQLEERDSSETDPEQMAHVKELMGKLDAAGVEASAGAAEGDAEWEDASEDEAMEE